METRVNLSMEEDRRCHRVFSGNYVESGETARFCRSQCCACCCSARRRCEARARSGLQVARWADAQALVAARAGGGGELLGDVVRAVPGRTAAAVEVGRELCRPSRPVRADLDRRAEEPREDSGGAGAAACVAARAGTTPTPTPWTASGWETSCPVRRFSTSKGEVVARIMGEAREEDVRSAVDWLLGGRSGAAPPPLIKRY